MIEKVPISEAKLENEQIDLLEVISLIWLKKSLIILIVFVCSVAGIIYSINLPNVYQSRALLAPVSSQSGGSGGLATKLGGLASLAGVSLSSGTADKTTIGIEILRSRKFIKEFTINFNLIPSLMASTDWNRQSDKLIFNQKIYDEYNGKWILKGDKLTPTAQEIYKSFSKNLSINQNPDTGFVTISFEHFSPTLSQSIVTNLIEEINREVKERDIKEAESSISFLREQIDQNRLTEIQTGLFQLIQAQTETIMLAKSRPEYLFQVIDPPIVEEQKIGPKRALICVFFALSGGAIGILVSLYLGFRDKSKGDLREFTES